MFEKLRSRFRVKESQDVRTLFTDPPISFAAEFPDIPKPGSALSPPLLAARWTLHDLYGEDMPAIAADLLEAGYDSPSLRRLAAESMIERSGDVEKLVAAVFRDIHAPYPISKNEAYLILSQQIAREVISGQRNPWAAASNIVIAICGWKFDHPLVGALSELLDRLDWDSFNNDELPQMTSELIETFALLAAQTEPEKRISH
jgi:hypothetical protein